MPGLCCPGNHRYYDLLRLLRRRPRDFISSTYTDRLRQLWCRRPGRSLLFRRLLSQHSASLTPEGSSRTAFPDSSSLLLPSSHSTDSAPSCPVSRLSLRRCRIHFMLRTAVSHVLLELLSSLRHIQSPDASEDSYPTLWRLSGLDFHQQAHDSFQNGPQWALLVVLCGTPGGS